MANAPIEMMLDGIAWTPVDRESFPDRLDIPYATHEGILIIGNFKLRCKGSTRANEYLTLMMLPNFSAEKRGY